MIIYSHRINTVKDMKGLPGGLGAEIDVRDHRDALVAAHDPFIGGESFEEVLSAAWQRPLIINMKCEGIETAVISTLAKYNIENYFLLDCTFPAIVKLCSRGFTKIALRFSEFEGLDTLVKMQGKAKWVWADCFTKQPFSFSNFMGIKKLGYKICLVSPDILGRPGQIKQIVGWLKSKKCFPDAVCVKFAHKDPWAEIEKLY